ncbi:MAG: DNA repair protein RadC [Gammaproteobacteria bacterium]
MRAQTKGISSWPEGERPRERLFKHGAEALMDAELIAILLRVGVRGMNAVELARQLLETFGSLRGMAEASTLALLNVKGLKNAKVAQLAAAIEIARRIAHKPNEQRPRITSTAQAGEYLRHKLRALPEEHFRVLYLNRRNTLLSDILIASGETAKVQISLRQIVANALRVNSSAIIAAHNHPSGGVEPSESDRLLTKDLIAATRPLNIRVLDHLIVGGEDFYSFADSGLLDELEFECLAPGATEKSPQLKREK